MNGWRETLGIWLLGGLAGLAAIAGPQVLPQLLGISPVLALPLAILSVVVAAGCAVVAFQAVRFVLRSPSERRWRVTLFETNYGRQAGWYVERGGRRVALLLDPRFEEMFWDSYRVQPLVDDPEERRRILSSREWWRQSELVFRNRQIDAVADTAFAGGRVFTDDGRVLMRGLHFGIGPPDCWERAVLWLRRRLGVAWTDDLAADAIMRDNRRRE
jgi:hypothetical protein